MRRLMLIDDDAELDELFEYAAHSEDLIILIQHGGLSALKSLAKLNYDVDAIICDLSMPDIDGISMTSQVRNNENIRSKSHPIPIFWYTGWPITETIERAKQRYAVTGIFKKPVNPVEIIREVKEMLN